MKVRRCWCGERIIAPVSDKFFLLPLAIIIISVVIGGFAPPLRQAIPPRLLLCVLAISAAFGLLTVACLVAGLSSDWFALACVLSASIFILYMWLADTAASGGNGGGGGGGPDDHDPRPPCDWDEFDRLRARWSAQRPVSQRPVGV